MAVGVAVSPALLHWAVERSGRGPDAFEQHFPHWDDWIDADRLPTVHQVEEIASFSHLPFGAFFLDEPPVPELPIPDFRLGTNGDRAEPSQELLDVIEASQRRQDWFRDYTIVHDFGPAQVTPIPKSSPTASAALTIAADLCFTVDDRAHLSREQARNHLRRTFEALGGIAVFTTMVGNNNTRPLLRDEFRGFALADTYAPLIFVNAHDDSLAGQIFTFIHEYAHISRGESGVGDESNLLDDDTELAVERWCNTVAGQLLVPGDDLAAHFDPDRPHVSMLDELGRRYLASTLTVMVRLRESRLIPHSGFDEAFEAEQRRVAELVATQPARTGGNHYLNQPFRLGEAFSRAVIDDVRRGGTGYSEALSLLNMRSVTHLNKYAAKLGIE